MLPAFIGWLQFGSSRRRRRGRWLSRGSSRPTLSCIGLRLLLLCSECSLRLRLGRILLGLGEQKGRAGSLGHRGRGRLFLCTHRGTRLSRTTRASRLSTWWLSRFGGGGGGVGWAGARAATGTAVPPRPMDAKQASSTAMVRRLASPHVGSRSGFPTLPAPAMCEKRRTMATVW